MEHYWFGWVTIPFGWILLHLSIFVMLGAKSPTRMSSFAMDILFKVIFCGLL